MLIKVEARTPQGDLLTLPFDDIVSGYLAEDVGGLDPVKATLISSSFAALDGEQYQSSRRETRNIKLKLGLYPDFEVGQIVRTLRTGLYKFFSPKSAVYLRFYTTDDLVVDILGRVESCEAPLFTKEPKADISIVCFDPDFYELESTVIEGDTVEDSTNLSIEYQGSVEVGFVFVLHVDRSVSEFTIYYKGTDGIDRSMDFAAALVAGDEVTISTVKGNKHATLVRSSIESSVLFAVSPQSSWEGFQPGGTNTFRVYATGAAIPYDVSYLAKYGGL